MKFLSVIILWLLAGSAKAQKLAFENFGVDRGLIQSQALCFAQDSQHHLWIGTYSGLDRFDGSSFKHYNRFDGLASNSVMCLYTASDGMIWIGTFKGISSYNGYKFRNYATQQDAANCNFITIAEDDKGIIWGLDLQKGLFWIPGDKMERAPLPFETAIPTCLLRNDRGELLIGFSGKGVYAYAGNAWTEVLPSSKLNRDEYLFSLLQFDNYYIAVTNFKRILKIRSGNVVQSASLDVHAITSSCIDHTGNIWIGTEKGAVVVDKDYFLARFRGDAATGLTDNAIMSLYKDLEENIWIGTDGEGIYRFSNSLFKKFDKTTGLPGSIVMGFGATASGDLYIADREGGLTKYDARSNKLAPVNYSSISKLGVNCMHVDKHEMVYVCTIDNKLMKYDGRSFAEMTLDPTLNPMINTIASQGKRVWFSTSAGCYYSEENRVHKVAQIHDIAIGLLPLESGETYIGTPSGLYLHSEKTGAVRIQLPQLQNTTVLCINTYKQYIVMGSDDEGIFFWDRQANKIYNCNTRNGMADDRVFALFIDSKKRIWAGTGTGLQQIVFDEQTKTFTVKKFSRAYGYESAETNLNAILEDARGNIWIGTTKGAFICKDTVSLAPGLPPFAVIQRVLSPGMQPSPQGALSKWYSHPVNPEISFSKNNISFNVKGILLRNPDAVLYSCKLDGYDTAFPVPSPQAFYNYQNLEPGKYSFKVKAFNEEGAASDIAEYSFSVATPLYKEKWFLGLGVASLVLSGAIIQLLISKAKRKKKMLLKELREEEHQKLKQRTAEDLHDELGNKLTRISLLADILEKKIANQSGEETAGIIRQIKENSVALYDGTKEILWSLSSGSNDLRKVIERIAQFGMGLFSDTEITFSCAGLNAIPENIHMPADYSRNLLMISKELLNNSLRHAHCTEVSVTAELLQQKECIIIFKDDGKGFDAGKPSKGNGLNNIRNRAKRLNGSLEIVSVENGGSIFRLWFNIP